MDISLYKALETHFRGQQKHNDSPLTDVQEQFLELFDTSTPQETVLELIERLPIISEKLTRNDLSDDVIKLIVDEFSEHNSEISASVLLCISVSEHYAQTLCRFGIFDIILRIIGGAQPGAALSPLFRISGNCFVGLDASAAAACCGVIARHCLGRIIHVDDTHEAYYAWLRCLYAYAASARATAAGMRHVLCGVGDFVEYCRAGGRTGGAQEITTVILWILQICIDSERGFRLDIAPLLASGFFGAKERYLSADAGDELATAFVCLCGNLLSDYGCNAFGLRAADAYGLYVRRRSLWAPATWLIGRLCAFSRECAEEFAAMDLAPFAEAYSAQSFAEKCETAHMFVCVFERIRNRRALFAANAELFIAFLQLGTGVASAALRCVEMLFDECGAEEEREQLTALLAENGAEELVAELTENRCVPKELLNCLPRKWGGEETQNNDLNKL